MEINTLDIQLTPHFSLHEFTNSNFKHEIPNNIKRLNAIYTNRDGWTVTLYDNAMRTLQMLELLRYTLNRNYFGYNEDVPFIITSGIRSIRLNQLVGGWENSDHIWGLAVDWFPYLKAKEMGDLYEFMKKEKPIHIGEFIYYPKRNFFHTSIFGVRGKENIYFTKE